MFNRFYGTLLLTGLSLALLSWTGALKKTYAIIGETIALSGEAPSFLLKKDARVKKVYLLNAQGPETVFREGRDYLQVKGGLRRTVHSAIPDFATHKTVLKPDGKFSWRNDPGMNPPLSLQWQVMVDYTTAADTAIAPQSRYLSEALSTKLRNKQPLSIYSIGTSITEGAHTLARYHRNSDESVYPQLVARALRRLYGNEVTMTNLAVGGSTSALLAARTSYLLEQRPDVVLIEFGMNEHLAGADMDAHLATVEQGVKTLRAAGIDCVLVGFFQQNPAWDLEDVAATVYYNNKLREMAARHHTYFADIYTLFQSLPQEKLYRDLMGDYLHHPTASGHELYYLATMPVFLEKASSESALRAAIR